MQIKNVWDVDATRIGVTIKQPLQSEIKKLKGVCVGEEVENHYNIYWFSKLHKQHFLELLNQGR